MTKPTTAAQYRAMLAAKRKTRPTEIVTVPSGLDFELQRPDLEAFVVTGRYPQSIVQHALKAMKEKGIAPNDFDKINELTLTLDEEQLNEALIFMRELVREACINPKIVFGASKDDEIDPSEIDIDDFNYIFAWCVEYKGVKNAAGIRTFRGGSERATAGSEPDGEELQPASVQLPAD